MSLVKIVRRLVFLLKCKFISHHYYTHINVITLVHLSLLEFACDRLNVCSLHSDEGHRSARKLCVLTCINKVY